MIEFFFQLNHTSNVKFGPLREGGMWPDAPTAQCLTVKLVSGDSCMGIKFCILADQFPAWLCKEVLCSDFRVAEIRSVHILSRDHTVMSLSYEKWIAL